MKKYNSVWELLNNIDESIRSKDLINEVDKSVSSIYNEIRGLLLRDMIEKIQIKQDENKRFIIVAYKKKK